MKRDNKIIKYLLNKNDHNYIIQELKSIFGKKYCVVSPDNAVGIINYYSLDETFELSVLKSQGESEYIFFHPNKNSNVIGILYCTGGVLSFSTFDNKETFYIQKGDILIYRRDDKLLRNYNFISKNMENILIYLHLDKFEKVLSKSVNSKVLNSWEKKLFKIFEKSSFSYGISNDKIRNIANWIDNNSVDSIENFLYLKQNVFNFILLILDIKLNSIEKIVLKNKEIVENIKSLISNYPFSKIPTLKEISEFTNLSIYQINLSFMKIEKTTLPKYILRLKMEYAALLLRESQKSITEVSFEIGYESPSKFSKNFKNHFGILPNEYRRRKV